MEILIQLRRKTRLKMCIIFLNQSKILALDYLFGEEQLTIFLAQKDVKNTLKKYKTKLRKN